VRSNYYGVARGRSLRQGGVREWPARRDDQACLRRRLRAEADDRMICARLRIICSPAKRGYTARAPTLRPTRHPGAYSINQNHRTCEEKYDYASAAAAIKRDTPGND